MTDSLKTIITMGLGIFAADAFAGVYGTSIRPGAGGLEMAMAKAAGFVGGAWVGRAIVR